MTDSVDTRTSDETVRPPELRETPLLDSITATVRTFAPTHAEQRWLFSSLPPMAEGEKSLGNASSEAIALHSLYLLGQRAAMHQFVDDVIARQEFDIPDTTHLQAIDALKWEAVRRQFPSADCIGIRVGWQCVELKPDAERAGSGFPTDPLFEFLKKVFAKAGGT
jgi:hypothetical protein